LNQIRPHLVQGQIGAHANSTKEKQNHEAPHLSDGHFDRSLDVRRNSGNA
jgi:hypothetical protein